MSSPIASAGPDRSFQSRLNRVAEARAPLEAGKPEIAVLPDWKRDVFSKSGIPLAILFGVLSVFIVRLGLFHYSGNALITNTPNKTLAIEVSAALILSLLLFIALPFKGISYKLAQLAGVGIMVVAMHNAVHSAPGFHSLLFSLDWTDKVIAATEPASLLVLGDVIPLVPAPVEDEVEPVMPTILRLN